MSKKTGKIPASTDQDSDQRQHNALIARVIECIPKLNHDDRQELLGDSKLPGRVKVALTPWPKSDKFASPPRECIPPLEVQFGMFRKITSRLPDGLDFLGRKVHYGSTEHEIEEHKAFGPQLLLCDDLGDPVRTAHFLLEYIQEKWVEMDPKRHCVEMDERMRFVGDDLTIRLRVGSEDEQIEGRPVTKASRQHFDHPYTFMLTDQAPLRASNMTPVVNYRHIADMYDYMRLGVCEPLWFLAYFPEYLYWSGKDPTAFPGMDLGDLSVQGFSDFHCMVIDQDRGHWREAELDGHNVQTMNAVMANIKEFGRDLEKSGAVGQLVDDMLSPSGSRELRDHEVLTNKERNEKLVMESDERLSATQQERTSPPPPPVWQKSPFLYVKDNTLHITSCGISGRFIDIPAYTMMGKVCAGM